MRLRLLFLWLVGGLTVTGCAPSLALHTSVPYRVDSTPSGSTVLVDGQVVGTVGVIGPTRMAYERVIPIGDVTAKLVSTALSQH